MHYYFSAPSELRAVVPAGDGFLLQGEDGFYHWKERVSELIPYEDAIVPNSICATGKEASFAVSATEWRHIVLSDGSVKALPSREALVCHARGVVGLKSGAVRWPDETSHPVPALASSSRAHMVVLPNDRVVVLTGSDADGQECLCTVVGKADGIIGEWRTSRKWPSCVHGWTGGILWDNEVLSWERHGFTVKGELPPADLILVHNDVALELRRMAKSISCTIRSLHTGFVCQTIKLVTGKGDIRIGAVSDVGFVVVTTQEARFCRLSNFQPALLSKLCVPRPVAPQSPLWSLVQSVNEQMTSGISKENKKRLISLTRSNKKRQKCMQELTTEVKNGAPVSQGLLHVIKTGNMMSVAETLIAEDLSEETRIAILSSFPSLVFQMLYRAQYSRDEMRNALRKLAPEAIAVVLEQLKTLLKAYQSCGVKISTILAVPSYDQTLAFLELLLDARILDLAVACPTAILGIRDLLNQEVRAQIQLERLLGMVSAQITAHAERAPKDPIEIWHLPF